MDKSIFNFKRCTIPLLLSIGVFLSYGQSGAQTVDSTVTIPDVSGLVEIRIDPNSPIKDLKTSDFLESCRFLPLETTKESAFGSISQLEITDDRYIIWDEATNAILLFDKKGKFLAKITNTDKSVPVPFKRIRKFSVNKQRREITFDDLMSPNMYIYSLDGKYIRHVRKPIVMNSSFASIGEFDLFDLAYDSYRISKLKISPVNLVITKRNTIKLMAFPFDSTIVNSSDVYSVDQAFYNNQDGFINFSTYYNYNIYSVDSNATLRHTFRIVMPAINTVPEDFLKNSIYTNKRLNYTNSNDEILYSITDFYKRQDVVVFRLFGHSANNMYAYGIKSGSLISLNDCISDRSTYMLPCFRQRIFAMDTDGSFVSAVDAIALFDSKLKLAGDRSWDSSLSNELKAFFKSDNQQNPVLTIFTLKQSI